MPLSGRRAVVTGASGGIGSAIVRALMAQGATVHCLDRVRPDAVDMGEAALYQVDLADRTATDRVLGELCTELGGACDILVNGAGISRVCPFEASDDVLLDAHFAVNFTAAFRVTRTLLPMLRASGRASVVNIASELAMVGQTGFSAYSASKGALLAWSRTLAIELAGDRIRVNAVCPGPTDTDMLANEFATAPDALQARRQEIAGIPAGRLGTPAEIAAVIAFLAGDASAYVTGAAWSVDGGKTAS